MKYYIIAGEASGDLHAANLIKGIKEKDPDAEFRVWGGEKMQAEGAELVKHYRDLAFMGFIEVLFNIRTILRNIRFCKNDMDSYKPDAVILVDYPGFNLRIAKYAKKQGFKVLYYISPTVWAWKESRVHTVRKYVDRMFVILPFEQEVYAKFGVFVSYFGHPLLDAVNEYHPKSKADIIQQLGLNPDKKIVAVMPGSRKQEVEKILPLFLEVKKQFSDIQFVLACAPSLDKEYYAKWTNQDDIFVMYDQTYDLLANADTALVASGTATLETALFKVPQVVCYKVNPISYLIARCLVKIEYISLVNLIMNRPVLKEYIQHDFTVENVAKELDLLLNDVAYKEQIQKDYNDLKELLGNDGASRKTGVAMVTFLKS